MKLKLATAALLFAAIPVVAQAQQNIPPGQVPKPTVADVQKVVQAVSADQAKLRAYCDMGKVLMQLDQAEQKRDANAIKALSAKADGLAQQLGPDYARVMDGLSNVDPRSEEGKRYGVLFEPLYKQCR